MSENGDNNTLSSVITDNWKNFFEGYKITQDLNNGDGTIIKKDIYFYFDQLLQMRAAPPITPKHEHGTAIFYVEVRHIDDALIEAEADKDETVVKILKSLRHQLIYDYFSAETNIKEAVSQLLEKQQPEYFEEIKNKIIICVKGLRESRRFNEVGGDLVGKLICVDGMLTYYDNDSQVDIVYSTWLCGEGHENAVRGANAPKKCSHCGGAITMEMEEKRKMVDFFYVGVQEKDRDMREGKVYPEGLSIRFNGNELIQRYKETIIPGASVKVVGTIRLVKPTGDSKSSVRDLEMLGSSLEMVDELDDEQQSAIDKEIDALVEQPIDNYAINDHVEKLQKSICFHLNGVDEEKMAVLLLLAGSDPTLDQSGMRIRGELNLLFYGPPGTGKTDFLKFANAIRKRSVYAEGKLASAVGLTAGISTDEGVRSGGKKTKRVSIGIYLLAADGIACVDEIDKLREDDVAQLTHVLDDWQEINLSKAGIHRKFYARCASLHAGNPTKNRGAYDSSIPYHEQTSLPAYADSRYDLILIINYDKSKGAANGMWKAQENRFKGRRIKVETEGRHEDNLVDVLGDGVYFPIRYLQREMEFVRRTYHPLLMPGTAAWTQMQTFFDSLADMNMITTSNDDDPINSDPNRIFLPVLDKRKINTLTRLAQASARLHRRNDVQPIDMDIACRLVWLMVTRMLPNQDFDKGGAAGARVSEVIGPLVTKNMNSEWTKQARLFTDGLFKYIRIVHKIIWEPCRNSKCDHGKIRREGMDRPVPCMACNGEGGQYVKFDPHILERELVQDQHTFTRYECEQYFGVLRNARAMQKIGRDGYWFKPVVDLTSKTFLESIKARIMTRDAPVDQVRQHKMEQDPAIQDAEEDLSKFG